MQDFLNKQIKKLQTLNSIASANQQNLYLSKQPDIKNN